MANTIQIRRSTGTSRSNASLSDGELAHLQGTGAVGDDGGRLLIGTASSGVAVIGGDYFTAFLDHTPGTATATSALITDSTNAVSLLRSGTNATAAGQVDFLEGTNNGTAYISLVGQADTDTNKTLTLPNATDQLIGKATTDTLTNKSVNLTNNTLTGTLAQFNTALSDDDFVSLTGTETLTNKTFTSPTINTPTIGTSLTIGSAIMSETDLEKLDDITNGVVTASKALVVNGNKDIGTLRNLTIDGVFTDGNYTFDTSGNVSGLGTVSSGAITSSGSITAGTSLIIGSAEINETDLEKLDGITNGAATASKALVVDANLDINLGLGDITATNLTGSIQTASQGNITTLGTLTGLTVDGDLTVADGTNDFDVASHDGTNGLKLGGVLVSASSAEINVLDGATAGTAVASKALVVDATLDINLGLGDITATNLTGSIQTASQGNITTLGTLTGLTIAADKTVSMGSNKITNVADPSQAQDAATKSYVDAVKTGLDIKDSVDIATTDALDTSSYDNGTLGVGATLIASANGAINSSTGLGQSITLVVDSRVLVKDQSSDLQNGIYKVTTVGDGSTAWALTRATDADSNNEITGGSFTFVEKGTNADNGYVFTHLGNPTMGTTSLTVAQFSGAGQIVAGAGLTKLANTLNVVGTIDRIDVITDAIDIASGYIGQSSITTLGTIGTGTWGANDVAVAHGGTGVSTLTSNGILYGNGTDSIQTTAVGTDGYLLISNSGTPEWTNTIDGGTFDAE